MYDVSIIIPIYNAEKFIVECLQSILTQKFTGTLQVSIFNDGSTDDSLKLINNFLQGFSLHNIDVIVSSHEVALGPGFARNKAVRQSGGRFLCFLDADDIMLPNRISSQFNFCKNHLGYLIGSRFFRQPELSTQRYTRWANNLTNQQLYLRAYSSHSPTLIMPTWFCCRSIYDKIGGFDQTGRTTPDDLIFFYNHLKLGGKLYLIDEELIIYRYHLGSVSSTISEDTIWHLRLKELENNILTKWDSFVVWNAGKMGRKFYRTCRVKEKISAFCDVSAKKIAKGYYVHEFGSEIPKKRIPILHFEHAKPPFIICVKLDLTDGHFEQNLDSLNLTEGKDYIHFG